MKKTLLFLTALFCAAALPLRMEAQSFVPRTTGFSAKKTCHLTLQNGEQISGYFKKVKLKKGLVEQLTMEDEQGKKHKVNSSEIKLFKVPPSKMGQLGSVLEGTASVKKMVDTDFSAILEKEYVVFEQALLPGRKAAYVLLQLVNPGFDGKIKIYDDPRAKETFGIGVAGIQATGGMLKSYYTVKEGVALKIEKKNYEEYFDTLYGDCPELIGNYPEKQFNRFAEHVFVYDQGCK
jgi:hypothetical protein